METKIIYCVADHSARRLYRFEDKDEAQSFFNETVKRVGGDSCELVEEEIQAKRFAPAHDEDYSSENDWYESFEEAVEAAKAWAEESEVDLSTFYIIEEECDEDGVWDEENQSLLSLAGVRL